MVVLKMSLVDNGLDFNSIEKNVFDEVCEIGRNMIKTILGILDKELMESRNKSEYRHKGLKTTSIKTVLGTVEFRRAIYECFNNEGKSQFVYLLDKYLNMETIGCMSCNLVEKVVENTSDMAFRKAARNVSKLTGQSISHTAAWNVTQEMGKHLQEQEKEKIKKHENGNLNGEKEVEIIFEEVDGLYISMQGKDRPNGKKSRGKREIKIGVSYEGWKKSPGKREAYVVENKKVVAGFMKAEEFKGLRDASLAESYNMNKIRFRILNADGAEWAKNGLESGVDFFQLDKFHISKAITRAVYEKEIKKELTELAKGLDIQKLLNRIEELKYECGGEYGKVEKLVELQKYLSNNREGLISYKNRLNVPEPKGGQYYRNLGTMEHNVFDVLGCRMKKRKMSWSIAGANSMAKILASKASGSLYEVISNVLSSKATSRLTEVFEEVVKQAKDVVNPKRNIYPTHRGDIPFGNCAVTNGRKAIRRMFNLQSFTELTYK